MSARYRLLALGEVIEAEDEILLDDAETWHAVTWHVVGIPYNAGFFVPTRRKLYPV